MATPLPADLPQGPMRVKTLIFHFASGRDRAIDLSNYTFRQDASGIFIMEPVKEHTAILTPNTKYRVVEFIQMMNVDNVEFKYFE